MSEKKIENKETKENKDAVETTASTEATTKEEPKEEKVDRFNTFRVGDTVRVLYRIIEAGKERIQPYEGVVIGKKGKGISKTFMVRRVGAGQVGVERIFPAYSPKISDIEVMRKGKVRRAKLFYLRDIIGRKQGKIKERV